jgi:hypothetical protein
MAQRQAAGPARGGVLLAGPGLLILPIAAAGGWPRGAGKDQL